MTFEWYLSVSDIPLVVLSIPAALKWQFSDTGLAVNWHSSQVAVKWLLSGRGVEMLSEWQYSGIQVTMEWLAFALDWHHLSPADTGHKVRLDT